MVIIHLKSTFLFFLFYLKNIFQIKNESSIKIKIKKQKIKTKMTNRLITNGIANYIVFETSFSADIYVYLCKLSARTCFTFFSLFHLNFHFLFFAFCFSLFFFFLLTKSKMSKKRKKVVIINLKLALQMF